jgi:hypothetical protein
LDPDPYLGTRSQFKGEYPVPNNTAIYFYILESLKMLLFPFMAILMVASFCHISGGETLPIPLLADFGKTILGPVQKYCQELVEDDVKEIENNQILCKSANALDKKLFDFGKNIMEQMNFGNPGANETGHTVSQL